MAVKKESFEGLTATANSPLVGDFLRPGALSTYTFDSGLKLTWPIPNTGEVVIGDLVAQPGAAFGLPGNGSINGTEDVPFGSAYLAIDNAPNASLRFEFKQKVYTVGAFVSGEGGSQNSIAAYTDSGKLISGASIKSVPIADWGTNYVTVTSKQAISHVIFNGDYLVMDKVKFDTSKPDVIKGKKKGGTKTGTRFIGPGGRPRAGSPDTSGLSGRSTPG